MVVAVEEENGVTVLEDRLWGHVRPFRGGLSKVTRILMQWVELLGESSTTRGLCIMFAGFVLLGPN